MDAEHWPILVVGGGALGTLLASRWRDGGRAVTLLARGARGDRLAAAGWDVLRAADPAWRRFPLIVLATRGYDVAEAAADALAFADRNTLLALTSRDECAAASVGAAHPGPVLTLCWDGCVAAPPAARSEVRHDANRLAIGCEGRTDWTDRLRLEAAARCLSVAGFSCEVVDDVARRRRTGLLQWLLTECTAALLRVPPAVALDDPLHAPTHEALVQGLQRLAWRGHFTVDEDWATCWRGLVAAGGAPAHAQTLDDLRAWRALEMCWALDSLDAASVDPASPLGIARQSARLHHAERYRRLGIRPPRGQRLPGTPRRARVPQPQDDGKPGSYA